MAILPDELIEEKFIDSRDIKVRNVGDIYLDNKNEFCMAKKPKIKASARIFNYLE